MRLVVLRVKAATTGRGDIPCEVVALGCMLGMELLGFLSSRAPKHPQPLSSGGSSVSKVQYIPVGYQQITTLTTSTALTVPLGAQYALIQCQVQAVRWRDDGTAPTATVGMRLPVGAERWHDGPLAQLRFIEEVVGAILDISYYG